MLSFSHTKPTLRGAIAFALVAGAPGSALAAEGLYFGLGVGYGSFSGSNLITQKIPGSADRPVTDPASCCAGGGLAFDLRLGYAIFGMVAPEFVLVGDGWNLGADTGGGGFVGGGVRLFPIGIIERLTGKLSLPIDLGVGIDGGYAIMGKDFAYTGSWLGFDGTLDYKLSSVVSLGARINYEIPMYGNFVYTDYKNSLGRCLQNDGTQPPVDAVIHKGDTPCTGSGPGGGFISPQLVATFHFALFE
jgi:hypothetical protein